jgi:hypothetical protein
MTLDVACARDVPAGNLGISIGEKGGIAATLLAAALRGILPASPFGRRRRGAPVSCAAAVAAAGRTSGSNPVHLLANENKKGPEGPFIVFILAEREGFEPSKGF